MQARSAMGTWRGPSAERPDERMHEHHAKKFFPSPEIDGGRERARERRQEITLPKRPTRRLRQILRAKDFSEH